MNKVLRKALSQGYVYFKERIGTEPKTHIGYVTEYSAPIPSYDEESITVAYGVQFHFNHPVNGDYGLCLEDCDKKFILNPKKHWAHAESYSWGFLKSYPLTPNDYGRLWAITKEELL